MQYIDGFVLAVPEANLPAYRKMARRAGKVWIEHGALQYVDASALTSSPETRRECLNLRVGGA